MRLSRLDWLLLLTLSVLTFEKIRWETSSVTLTWTNLLATAFVVAFVIDRIRHRDLLLHPAAITLAGFMLAFGAVYLAGYFDLTDRAALTYWLKGIGTWAIHFTYLILGVAHMVRRGRPLFLRAIYAFTAGIVVNCVYGVIQLALAIAAGINLDRLVVGPAHGRAGRHRRHQRLRHGVGLAERLPDQRADRRSQPPRRDAVRPADDAPALLPGRPPRPPPDRPPAALHARRPGADAVALGRARRRRRPGGARSRRCAGTCRGRARSASAVGGIAAALAALYASSHFVRAVVAARTQLHGGSTQTHLQFYQLVPPALDPHPLFGMGFNTFAVFYQFVTGRTDFGPHSAWIAILVETGLVGMALYLVYFAYLLASAAAIRHAPDPDIARLGQGLLAALVATGAGNLFYLTMTFDYFYALALLAVAGAAMFAPARARAAARAARGGRGGAVILALEIAFWASLAALVWTHLLYPLAIALLARVRPRPVAAADILPTVSLIIPAYNEEDVIEAKLENALALDYPADRLEIVVTSDDSTDGTHAARRALRRPRRAPDPLPARRQGGGAGPGGGRDRPARSSRSATPTCAGTPTRCGGWCGRSPTRQVGMACGNVRLENPAGGTNQEGLYWRYEMWLRRRESLVHSMTGSNGAIYAVRREAYRAGRSPLRARPELPVSHGAERLPGRVRAVRAGDREHDHRHRGRVPPQGAHVRALLADPVSRAHVRPAPAGAGLLGRDRLPPPAALLERPAAPGAARDQRRARDPRHRLRGGAPGRSWPGSRWWRSRCSCAAACACCACCTTTCW